MSNMQDISEETLGALAAITKAQTTGITTSTGITSFDLSPLVTLVPVVTPFRDIVTRTKSPDGNKYAVWRSILNATNAQPDPSIPFDYAANEVIFNEQDFQAAYKGTGLAGMVTQDAYDLAMGYDDPYATATFNTLNQVLIGDDRKLLGAQSFALAQPAAPSLTQHATGGTIGAVQVYVGVAARTGSGYYYGSGNSQGNSNSTTFGSGSTNSVSATVTAVRGAVCYDWFQSANGSTWYYYTTTTVNAVTMTRVISANNTLPTGTAVPDLTTVWKGTASSVPTYLSSGDNGSANTADYDGLLASLSGDYNGSGQWVQPGTGTANPSIANSLDGAALTLSGGSVTEIENLLFLPLWQQVKCSPTALMMNAAQAQEIANLVLGGSSATTFLNTDASGRISVTAGGRVGELVNAPAGGVTVPIEVHVSLPPGTIIARTDRVPFPQANIGSVLEYRALRDMVQFDYGVNRIANTAGGGPRREFEIKSMGAFLNKAPVAMASLTNVS
ncbi:hypothetical protein [Kitasatospora kifunensis]|uniref:Uncharacterized protein n=1 Tax=Kitasatospora kifunensis TaxID=58351 RepID=A0A7W7QYQ6_KITKI|nr:hypothetical protein [Kitasatospora kifunensis]MBB4922267.1 hypothetical protein [Kitasatospora kifunensis]